MFIKLSGTSEWTERFVLSSDVSVKSYSPFLGSYFEMHLIVTITYILEVYHNDPKYTDRHVSANNSLE